MPDFDTSINSLREQAEILGLQGDDIPKYILNQQAIAKEERNRERELKLRELEAERGKAEEENERARIEAEREKVKLTHELEMAKIKVGNNCNNSISPISVSGASLLDINEESYAVRLGSLLTGKAVEIYTSLSPEITADYKQLKRALLNGFNKTPNGYRQDFRAAKIKVGETYHQFSITLGRFFDQWLDSSGLEKS